MDREFISFLLVSLGSLLNLGLLVYQTFKKVPSEVGKMQAERAESLAEAAESNMQGAQISNTLLMERIRELKKEKRDAWNHIAKLEKQLIEANLHPAKYQPSDSEPRIKAIDS